jgi:hypothetical protein
MVHHRPAEMKAQGPPPFPPNLMQRLLAKIKLILLNITIEPAMFLISFSNSLDDVSVKQMQIYKSCHVDFGYNDTVCENLVSDFKPQNDEVQNEVHEVQQLKNLKKWEKNY